MELIKKIKESEVQGQKVIEQARTEAAKQAEKNQGKRVNELAEAEQERKKAIESAVAGAQSEGLAETKKLKAQAEKQRQQLCEKAAGKMAGAVAKVMDYLKG